MCRPAADREVPIRRHVRPVRPNSNDPRINHRIRKSPVRLIDADGTQVGVVPVEEARTRARDQNLDLVEVGPNADLSWDAMRDVR